MTGASWVAAALQPAIDAALALDPEARARVLRLEGAVLEVRVTGLELSVFVLPRGEHLRLAGASAEPAAARVAGPPASLAMLATAAGTHALFSGALHVNGDVAVAKAYKRLFDTLDPDWEEALARALGDVPGHEAGRLLHGLAAWGRRAWLGRRADLAAWLVDELESLPAPAEVEAWLAEVDRVRAHCDRLGARLARLERHHAGGGA